MIDVYEINSTTMKFKISNPVTRNRILKRAMWNIAEIPVVMAKWSPLTEDIKQETHSIPLWVHLHNVPMDMFSWKGLSFVSSPIGEPVRLHPETEQCTNLKIAKIFVKVDLSKEMPKSMYFTIQGKETLVEYTYPWLPPKCTTCGKWGHYARVCKGKAIVTEVGTNGREDIQDVGKEFEKAGHWKATYNEALMSGKTGTGESETQNKSVAGSDYKKESKSRETSNKEIRNEQREEVRSPIGTSYVDNAHSSGSGGTCVNQSGSSPNRSKKVEHNLVTEEDKSWSEVSPGKASRTPTQSSKLKFGQVSILSNSRFSVLSRNEEDDENQEDEEESEEVKRYKEEEKINKELDKVKVIGRQYLPRNSKTNHRYLSDTSVQGSRDGPGDLNKKNSFRNFQ